MLQRTYAYMERRVQLLCLGAEGDTSSKLAVPVGAVAPPYTRLRLVKSEWGGLANLSSEILCALFAVWQEFLDFDALTIAYCNTHTHTHTEREREREREREGDSNMTVQNLIVIRERTNKSV